jgi:hypothetical protein
MAQQFLACLNKDQLPLNLMIVPGFYENLRSTDIIALKDALFSDRI